MRESDTEGRLVVVCGIDGSGKTYQSKKLAGRLKKQDVQARYVEFPRYSEGFFGGLIARYLRGELGSEDGGISPHLASLPFACDRWEFSSRIRQWLEEGEIVICNRYVSANMAHQGGRIESESARREFYRWVEKMEYEVFGVPRPGVHLWLDIMPEHALMLLEKKGHRDYLQDGTDIHENQRHLLLAREAYAELARRASDWVRIQCSGENGPEPPERVADCIWEQIKYILEN